MQTLYFSYMYGGWLKECALSDVARLLIVGERFNVRSLVEACAHMLTNKLSRDNCIKRAVLGEEHKQLQLRDAVSSNCTYV